MTGWCFCKRLHSVSFIQQVTLNALCKSSLRHFDMICQMDVSILFLTTFSDFVSKAEAVFFSWFALQVWSEWWQIHSSVQVLYMVQKFMFRSSNWTVVYQMFYALWWFCFKPLSFFFHIAFCGRDIWSVLKDMQSFIKLIKGVASNFWEVVLKVVCTMH